MRLQGSGCNKRLGYFTVCKDPGVKLHCEDTHYRGNEDLTLTENGDTTATVTKISGESRLKGINSPAMNRAHLIHLQFLIGFFLSHELVFADLVE